MTKLISLLFLLSCGCILEAASAMEHLRLIWTEKPQTEAMIIWDSQKMTKGDRVWVWEASEAKVDSAEKQETQKKEFSSTGTKAYSKQETEYFFRHVPINGLKASTTYHLQAECDGDKSEVYTFMTAPEDERTFKLLYVGDSRTRAHVAKAISAQMAEMAHNDPEILAVIHGGDFANKPILSDWKPWLDAWDQTTHAKTKRLLPLIPVVGNHERIGQSKLYGEAYGYPGGLGRYLYSCRLTPQFRIAVLNSEIPSTGEQETFLKSTLEQYQSEQVKWRLAAFHRPVYPAIKKPSVIKRLVPLFEEFNLDLVLESDGHCVKRTLPIRGEKHDPSGVVYLGEGGYGAPQRKVKDRWFLKEPGFATAADHLMSLRVSAESIDYLAIDTKGKVIDKKTFLPKPR